jgi:hypothetical protein
MRGIFQSKEIAGIITQVSSLKEEKDELRMKLDYTAMSHSDLHNEFEFS